MKQSPAPGADLWLDSALAAVASLQMQPYIPTSRFQLTQIRGIGNDEEKVDFVASLFGLKNLLVIIIMTKLNSRIQ
jgi:hypothetical protein